MHLRVPLLLALPLLLAQEVTACVRLEAMPSPGTFKRECKSYPCPPAYPAAAIRERLEGSLVVEVTVSRDGLVLDAKVTLPSPYAILNEAALRSVNASRFPIHVPVSSSGPVCYQVSVPMEFTLKALGDES